MLNRLSALVCCAGVALGLAGASAMAMPPILERVPADAAMAVAIPSGDQLEKNLSALTTAIEFDLPLGLDDLLASAGMKGIADTTKSIGVVFMPPPPGKEGAAPIEGGAPPTPPTIALLPLTDYAKMVANFNGKPSGQDGIDELMLPNDEPAYSRNIGDGYAAVSDNKEALAAFKPGQGGAFTAGMSKVCRSIADSADIVAVINSKAAGEFAGGALKQLGGQLKEQMGALEGMGIDADDAGQSVTFKWLSERVREDSKIVVTGVKFSAMGIGIENGITFEEGSYMAKVFADKGNAAALLAKIPNQPFLLTGAMDTSSQGVKRLLKDIGDKAKADAAAGGGEQVPSLVFDTTGRDNGQAVVIGYNPQIVFGAGLFSNTVTYTSTTDSAKAAKEMQTVVESLNGKELQGTTYQTSYKPDGAKIGETTKTDVDVWEVKAAPGDGADGSGMEAQAMMFMFGPNGGPSGYVAKLDSGLIRTMGKNRALMAAALALAKGEGQALGGPNGDKLLAQVAGQLPSGRLAECYIGTRPVLEMLVPLAAFAGVTIDQDVIPESLPPIGMSLAGAEGSAQFSTFLPAPVLKVAAKIASGMISFGPGDEDEEPVDKPARPKEGTGQPRF